MRWPALTAVARALARSKARRHLHPVLLQDLFEVGEVPVAMKAKSYYGSCTHQKRKNLCAQNGQLRQAHFGGSSERVMPEDPAAKATEPK